MTTRVVRDDLRSKGDWVRLPVKQKDRLQGLSRTTIFELIEAGFVKSAVLTKPGSKRSIRLIFLPSLLDYLESCVQQPPAKPAALPSKTAPH